MAMKSLQDFFVHELKDLHNAENQILKALPKMIKAATSDDLKQAFQEHLEQTEHQVERLEQIFERLGINGRGKKCKAMEGLIEEGKALLSEKAEPHVMDAALIAAAQKVEHYEIAAYGCARTYARMLDDQESADVLQEILDEEGETDKRLTELAESHINAEALGAGE